MTRIPSPRSSLLTRAVLLVGVCVGLLTGCQSPYDDTRVGEQTLPVDFALSVHVAGGDDASRPTRYQSRYVVEPNRHLRVALGADVAKNYYPSLTRRLDHEQFLKLYQLVEQFDLMHEPSQAIANNQEPPRDPQTVIFTVQITARDHTHSYRTTPEASPGTEVLISELVNLRQAILPVPPIPPERPEPVRR